MQNKIGKLTNEQTARLDKMFSSVPKSKYKSRSQLETENAELRGKLASLELLEMKLNGGYILQGMDGYNPEFYEIVEREDDEE